MKWETAMLADGRLRPERGCPPAALACGFLVVIAFCHGCSSAGKERTSLGLDVQLRGNDYHIKWNPKSLLVTSAARVVLTIEDGGVKREFEVDRNQLRSPSIVYSPVTGRVKFRLAVYPRPAVEALSVGNELPTLQAAPIESIASTDPSGPPHSTSRQETAPRPAENRDLASGFAVQLGIFRSRAEAERYETVVRRDGLRSEVLPWSEPARSWRLRAGCVSTAAEAGSLADRLRQRFPGAVVVRGCTLASESRLDDRVRPAALASRSTAASVRTPRSAVSPAIR